VKTKKDITPKIERIDFSKIEKKWQKRWEDRKIFEVSKNSKKKKFYVLEMFPYPSSSGLHMGHAFNYTIGDIYARFKRMQGFNVLHPMGFDSFGLPAENAAIKAKSHPKKFTEEAIKNYIKQMKDLGLSYDWTREIETHKPKYYKWDQWIFLKMFEKDLAYRKKSPVNWCLECSTVLANEQVIGGKCWRHEDTNVQIKYLEQWFLKTTAYAEELLEGLDKLDDWPELIKTLQKNWIAKSEGINIKFNINGENWNVFTTRADTLMGVTFLVISAQHPKLIGLVTKEERREVEKFLNKIKSAKQEDIAQLEKEGVFTGSYAVHPITKEKIPVWTGNFVLAEYGSGMVMAVPAHDLRDFEFAKKYRIPIIRVISKENAPIRSFLMGAKEISDKELEGLGIKIIGKTKDEDRKIEIPEKNLKEYEKLIEDKLSTGFWNEYIGKEIVFMFKHENGKVERIILNKETENKIDTLAGEFSEASDEPSVWKWLADNSFYTDLIVHENFGYLENSGNFDWLSSEEAKEHITIYLKEKKLGEKTTNYKLRDWLISRQRFWGTPIPIIYCEKCGIIPVPEKDLPVILPEDIKFNSVENPLNVYEKFVNCKCYKCGGKARRETDTMDTFVNSSWYYLRYTDSKNDKEIFKTKNAEYWTPVDLYIGGKEHACLHLIYIRFYTKFLRDLGLIKIDEPAKRLFNQGVLAGTDGEKMSKSKGNVILPEIVSEKYGMDVARAFLVSIASPNKDIVWSESGIEGSWRFIKKIIDYFDNVKIGKSSEKTQHKINKAIKQVSENIEYLNYNLVVINLREVFENFEENMAKEDLEKFVKLLSPICPHIAEELWERLGKKSFVSLEKWPEFDEKKINEKFDIAEKALEQTVSDVMNILRIIKEKQNKEGKKVYLYVIPKELENYDALEIGKRVGLNVKTFAVNDAKKYDPENKSGKARLGKPAIFIEWDCES